ncbi:hypothetical protein F0L17_22120 [Streptomyces sp. TRM43335]|uniref:DUF8129 domain-containing protein n=1 Tax=Streptomyces taklimakanensis TaxID=2569853 RepID=A0A6G2BHK0_9ACTN|nr:hypothetical protein [Streptomyces taklimakanensis]MTE21761.1 hypothetical protein [Streptomyces taklimakanensis]
MSNTEHGELPFPDYDHLSAGELEHRIRSLSQEDLDRLLRHEREHGNRAHMVTLLTARLHQLQEGSPRSPGSAEPPAGPPGESGGSRVTPATSPQPYHPPPHGTPDQAAKPKGDRF